MGGGMLSSGKGIAIWLGNLWHAHSCLQVADIYSTAFLIWEGLLSLEDSSLMKYKWGLFNVMQVKVSIITTISVNMKTFLPMKAILVNLLFVYWIYNLKEGISRKIRKGCGVTLDLECTNEMLSNIYKRRQLSSFIYSQQYHLWVEWYNFLLKKRHDL